MAMLLVTMLVCGVIMLVCGVIMLLRGVIMLLRGVSMLLRGVIMLLRGFFIFFVVRVLSPVVGRCNLFLSFFKDTPRYRALLFNTTDAYSPYIRLLYIVKRKHTAICKCAFLS